MKLISWNVAGIRAALKKGLKEYFEKLDADIFCLQEIKALEHQIDFQPEGYQSYINSAKKLGYSGTAIYTRIKPISVKYGMDEYLEDFEGRIITLEFEKYYLITVYVPNVKRDISRLDYRMEWEECFLKYINKLNELKPVIICGDLNVAHNEIDLKNPKSNIGNAGFTYEEREKFSNLLKSGYIDTFRYLNPTLEEQYSWWSYMHSARERNIGWRIDYFVISDSLKEKIKEANIYQEILGSDHCPVGLEIDV